MKIIVCDSCEEASEVAAQLVADSIRVNPKALISFPGGDTPLGMVHVFTDMVNQGKIDISQAYYVSLDEWAGLSNQDEGSCGLFNWENIFNRLEKKKFADKHLINGKAEDMEEERVALNDYITRYGPLEVSVLGIGMNGHLGFNEPGVDFHLKAHIIELDEVTKRVMSKYFGDKFHPTHGITQGLGQIMEAKKVILIASGAHKADILYQAVHGPITNKVAASILQNHPDCYIIADRAAAEKL